MGEVGQFNGLLLYFVTFSLALVVSLYMVPIVRRIASTTGLLDKPDGRLKTQNEPMPYLGGLAIYLGFLVSLGLTVEFRHEVVGILLAATLILLLGLLDDIGGIAPGPKVIGQIIAVCVLIKSGIWVQIAIFPVWLDIVITVIAIIAISNAVNVIDVMDGLAGGVSLIAALSFFVVGLISENYVMATMAVALAGSIVGFLYHNFPPASIYMGDAGSLFLGFMLGALAINGQYVATHDIGLLAPIFILGIPIFDTLLVMVIRFRRGDPVYFGSADHFAIRLQKLRWSSKRIVFSTYAVAIALGCTALSIIYLSGYFAILISGITFLVIMGVGIWFIRIEIHSEQD
tara:strand:+ start:3743 stop:4774 length:1032 start_codon:yes stop_codon:yes gene_type:complete